MIRINLLPEEIQADEARRQISVALSSLGVLLAVLMVAVLVIRMAQAKSLEKDVARAQEEERKYQSIADRVNQLEEKRRQLQARRDVIQQLLKGRLVYPKFFEDFMNLLPTEIWVTNLVTTPEAGPGQLKVVADAQSVSSFAIADWLANLQNSALCSAVELGAITGQEQQEDNKAPILSFKMTFRYQRGDM